MLTTTGWMLVGMGFTGAMALQIIGKALLRPLGLLGGIESFFAPAGGCASVLASQVAKAKKEVLLLTPSLQSKALLEALLGAAGKGVSVEILLPSGQEKSSAGEISALVGAGACPFLAQESRILSTVLLVDHKNLAVGSVNQSNPGEPGVLEHLHLWKGDANLNNKHRELISNHKMQARPLGSPRGLEPIGQPQQAPQQATQIFQYPMTSQPAGQTIPAGIDQNNPGALLAAAREAAGRGDQAMAAALLEAAKQANQRMQMNSGVRAAA